MIADLRELIGKRPFVPFTIHTVDGGAMRVPTLNHVHIAPKAGRVFVFYDDGRWDNIRPLMISRLTIDQPTAGT
ncbi:hypothetical protein BH20VER1_BH20VER1_26840 [soil metagenome]